MASGLMVASTTIARLDALAARGVAAPTDPGVLSFVAVTVATVVGALLGLVTAGAMLFVVDAAGKRRVGRLGAAVLAGMVALVLPSAMWFVVAFSWTDPLLWLPYVAGGSLLIAIGTAIVVLRSERVARPSPRGESAATQVRRRITSLGHSDSTRAQ